MISREELIRKDKEKFRSARKIPPSGKQALGPLTERQTRLNSLAYSSRRKIMNFRQPDVYDHHMTFQNKRTYASKLLKTGLLVGRDSTS